MMAPSSVPGNSPDPYRSAVALSADGRLAASPDSRVLHVWETATGKVRRSLSLPDLLSSFALSADGTFAVTGMHNRLVHVWEVDTGRCLRTLEGHGTSVDQTVLSQDGTKLATGDLGSGLRAWELAWDFDFPSGGGG